MYFGLSGPGGTGKTTILNDLAPLLEDFSKKSGIPVFFQQERVRQIFAERYEAKYGGLDNLLAEKPMEFQLAVAEAFEKDAKFAAAHPEAIIVADRTGFDVGVYTSLLIKTATAGDAVLVDAIFEKIHQWMNSVTHVFLTSAFSVVAEKDGFRPDAYADPVVRAMEINMFKHIGILFPRVTPLSFDRTERVQTIMGVINAHVDSNRNL